MTVIKWNFIPPATLHMEGVKTVNIVIRAEKFWTPKGDILRAVANIAIWAVDFKNFEETDPTLAGSMSTIQLENNWYRVCLKNQKENLKFVKNYHWIIILKFKTTGRFQASWIRLKKKPMQNFNMIGRTQRWVLMYIFLNLSKTAFQNFLRNELNTWNVWNCTNLLHIYHISLNPLIFCKTNIMRFFWITVYLKIKLHK